MPDGRYGPKYLLVGSRLTDDTYMLRAILNGLNSYGREWGETLVIQGNGSLLDLENEVSDFRYLEYRQVGKISGPALVIAFMDRMSQNRATEQWLRDSAALGIPTFVVSTSFRR